MSELTFYSTLLTDIKQRIRQAQTKAILSANSEMILMYWDIGKMLVEKQKVEGWGAAVIPNLSKDIRNELPEIKGFSERNIGYMIRFAKEYRISILQQPVAKLPNLDLFLQIPWGHHKPQSELVRQALKDPYIFDFLTLSEPFAERELETELIKHLEKFLMELGAGFAFVGRQYHVVISNKDFYLDLLFYHLRLRCFVIIELKKGEFKAEYAGKMNFYCSAVDDLLRHPTDEKTIGLILCENKDKIFAEYALRDIHKPIGISEYELTRALPENLKGSLPSIEEIEAELNRDEGTEV